MCKIYSLLPLLALVLISIAEAAFERVVNETSNCRLESFMSTGSIVVRYDLYRYTLYPRYVLRHYPIQEPSQYVDNTVYNGFHQKVIFEFQSGMKYKIEIIDIRNDALNILCNVELLAETLRYDFAQNGSLIWSWPRVELTHFTKLWFEKEVRYWQISRIELSGSATSVVQYYVPVCTEYMAKLYGINGRFTQLLGSTLLNIESWNQTCYNPPPMEINVRRFNQYLAISWFANTENNLRLIVVNVEAERFKKRIEAKSNRTYIAVEVGRTEHGLISIIGVYNDVGKLMGQATF